MLVQELDLSGRAGLIPLARAFQDDIAAYAANPGMTTPELRQLAPSNNPGLHISGISMRIDLSARLVSGPLEWK